MTCLTFISYFQTALHWRWRTVKWDPLRYMMHNGPTPTLYVSHRKPNACIQTTDTTHTLLFADRFIGTLNEGRIEDSRGKAERWVCFCVPSSHFHMSLQGKTHRRNKQPLITWIRATQRDTMHVVPLNMPIRSNKLNSVDSIVLDFELFCFSGTGRRCCFTQNAGQHSPGGGRGQC